MTPTEEACIRPVLERIGIPLDRRECRGEAWFGWNGVALSLQAKDASDALHEAAHWMLATPERRALPDFGLVRLKDFKGGGPFRYADEEEAAASMLGILMERHLALDWRETWLLHSWEDAGRKGAADTLQQLRDVGLLRGLTPTCFLGAP